MESFRDFVYGKMLKEQDPLLTEMIFDVSSNQFAGSQMNQLQFLDLKNGMTQDSCAGGAIHWLGVYTTRNTGPAPHNGESGSTLSEILQERVPTKYYLSARAAEGIIRRSQTRDKSLPPILKEALEEIISLA